MKRGRARVLLLEDDVVSGVTLRLVLKVLQEYRPRWIGLYLGRPKTVQQLDAVPAEVDQTFLAEDWLEPGGREQAEAEFEEFFARTGTC